MTKNLENLRLELEENYKDFFLLLKERREIVAQIFITKNGSNGFDTTREGALVQKFKESLLALSLKELLSLSLLIEDHANSVGEYPAWSDRVHLESSCGEPFEMINPIWLKSIHPNLYNQLKLRKNY